MNDIIFDHDRLDVYRLSIDYVARSFVLAKDLSGLHGHARDQWLRAAQSIPLNIAEGNGKRSLKDRNRFFDIARGSALECASIQDVRAVGDGIDGESHRHGKQQLKRLVSMLTKLIARSENVAEPATQYQAEVDYEYEYRFAEYEHARGGRGARTIPSTGAGLAADFKWKVNLPGPVTGPVIGQKIRYAVSRQNSELEG